MNKKGILTIFIALFVAAIFGLVYLYTTNLSLLSPAREAKKNMTEKQTLTNQKSKTDRPFILIGDEKVYVEIANTPEKRSLGLSGQDSLAMDEGMLFTYEIANRPTFWMKDMQFDLDIIWIRDNQVIKIDKNVPAPAPEVANKDLPRYQPEENIDQVLEVAAGFADQNGIEVGENVSPIQSPEGNL